MTKPSIRQLTGATFVSGLLGLALKKLLDTFLQQGHLLSEKQAAKPLGIARITLLRARGTGRIDSFGLALVYSDLTEIDT